MKISETVGIDVSKLTIDVRIHTNQVYGQFENSKKGFKKMIVWVYKNTSAQKDRANSHFNVKHFKKVRFIPTSS